MMPDGPMGTTVGQQWTGTQAATQWHHSPLPFSLVYRSKIPFRKLLKIIIIIMEFRW